MKPATALAEAQVSGRSLLKRAVHRSRAASLDGLLERLFTLVFNGLVYPQIWEDPVVDMAAMEIGPHHHIVAIASGGCNILSYLTADPARITAVDLNRAHVALVRLKLAGLQHLSGWDGYYRFFGEADERCNMRDYRTLLRPVLDSETRHYWDGAPGPAGGATRTFAAISTGGASSAASLAQPMPWRGSTARI